MLHRVVRYSRNNGITTVIIRPLDFMWECAGEFITVNDYVNGINGIAYCDRWLLMCVFFFVLLKYRLSRTKPFWIKCEIIRQPEYMSRCIIHDGMKVRSFLFYFSSNEIFDWIFTGRFISKFLGIINLD